MSVLLPTLPSAAPLAGAVLFGFDDVTLPFRRGVEMHLVPGTNPEVVLRHGAEGEHDEVLLYYGTVVRVGDTFHMWYNGNYGAWQNDVNIEREHCVICYATSSDGVKWEKPELGLVEFNGSTANNIVALDEPYLWSTAAVLHDPDDPDPERRFKLAYHRGLVKGPAAFSVAFSADGLQWRRHDHNPVGPFRLEMAGITRFRDVYYVNGQSLSSRRGPFARQLWTFASTDFEHWSPAGVLGLDRSPDVSGPSTDADLHQFEEIHLGAGLWNRGNVIVGIYGQWHGHPTGDRRLTVIDLGLALSHDAVHFHEPIPNFRFIPAREQPESPVGGYMPALQQGQGMENVGDRTLYWYSLWRGTEGSGIRMVSWDRDRLGFVTPITRDAGVISCPIAVVDGDARVHVNASGLGDETRLRVSVLDEGFRPIPGRSGPDAAIVTSSDLKAPVTWNDTDRLTTSDGPIRLEVAFEGLRAEDAHLYAVYVGDANEA